MSGIGFPEGITAQYIVNNVQAKLLALRNALDDCHNLYQWISAYSAADLVAAGMDSTSAQAALNATADSDALYQMYNTGQLTSLPSGYVTPGSYKWGTSQRVVIGPLS